MGDTQERALTGPQASDADSREPAAEVIEVEVERMPPEGEAQATPGFGDVFKARIGPLTAGLIVDVVDLSTFGAPGLVIGALAGWVLAGQLRFSWRGRLSAAAACGVYCLFPPTNFLPLATLIAAFAPVRAQGQGQGRGRGRDQG